MVSIIFAIAVIAALLIPAGMLVMISIDTVQHVSGQLDNNTFTVPPPPDSIQQWPLVGDHLHNAWLLASSNLGAALQKFSPQLKDLSLVILGKAGGTIKELLMFTISIIISAVLMTTSEAGTLAVNKVMTRFAKERGPELTVLATATIRGVMLGVIGVAVIQAILSALGMLLVGVPAAGLWAGIVLILAVIQLPPLLILGPIAVWVFSFASTGAAVFFLLWALIVSGCDGILKPILMGRGVDAPMLVILVGALGGMILSGIIGLFVGAVIVAIFYTLFMAWVNEEVNNIQPADTTLLPPEGHK